MLWKIHFPFSSHTYTQLFATKPNKQTKESKTNSERRAQKEKKENVKILEKSMPCLAGSKSVKEIACERFSGNCARAASWLHCFLLVPRPAEGAGEGIARRKVEHGPKRDAAEGRRKHGRMRHVVSAKGTHSMRHEINLWQLLKVQHALHQWCGKAIAIELQ